MGDYAIEISNVCKEYRMYDKPSDRVLEAFRLGNKKRARKFEALKNVNFQVKRGETLGIIGTNGAGKSTLLKIITGVLKPTRGNVKIDGKISALLELGAGFNDEYSGIENIYLNGRMMGYNKKEMDERLEQIIHFADIGEFIHQPVKTYSSGMFARLAFAVAINVEPDILIVDEALSVGDIFFQNKCFKKFDELKRKGVTILFVSHDIGSVRQMCSRVLWLDRGEMRAFGGATEICDMYMDEKRKSAEYVSGHTKDEAAENIYIEKLQDRRNYPKLHQVKDSFQNDKVAIRTLYFEDEKGEIVNRLYVDKRYKTHIVVECLKDVENIIVGFVLETNKGLPLFDINNFINQREVLYGKKGEVLELIYEYSLPRIMNGVYLVGAAVAKGTQSKHDMLTWLHAIMELEVVNQGYNSSYIEIPSNIKVYSNQIENVSFI